MGQTLQWVGAALLTALLALILKKDSPVLSFVVALAGVIYLLWAMLTPVAELLRVSGQMLGAFAGAQSIYIPVGKAVCIAAVVRLAGAVCQDAGQAALAVQLELTGTAAAILVCLPLLTQVFDLVSRMIA